MSERFYPQVVGSGTGAYLLAKGLLANGHQVTVVTDRMIGELPGASELPFDMRYIDSFEEYIMGRCSPKNPTEQIYQVLKEGAFDIIHVHNLMPLLVISLIKSLVRCPVVFTIYNTPNGSQRAIGYFEDAELDLALAKSIAGSDVYSRLIATSQCYYDFALRLGVPEELINLCYLGVEQDNFAKHLEAKDSIDLRKYFGTQLDRRELIILLPGRIVERKGVVEAVRALAEVNKSRPAKLILTGMALPFSSEFGKRVKDEIKRSGMEGQIIVPKYTILREDLPFVYKRADIVVTPSYYEGLGLTAIETLQASRPLIATAVSGLNEVAKNDVNALTVPPRDSDALARAIVKLDDNPKLAKRLAVNGPKSIRKFDISEHVRKVQAIYEEIIGE